MITKELLQRFCSTDEMREHLRQPWTAGEFTYATDGRIAVRAPALPDVPPNERAPKPDAMEKIGFNYEQDFGLLDATALPPIETENCLTCDGSGLYKCGSCACEDCDGIGSNDKRVPVKIGTRTLSSLYLHKITSLGPIQIGLTGDPFTAARFKFESGEGVLMPMRQ